MGGEGAHRGDGVERGVGADAEVGAGDVVGDGGGDDAERDAELLELGSALHQLQAAREGLGGRGGVGTGRVRAAACPPPAPRPPLVTSKPPMMMSPWMPKLLMLLLISSKYFLGKVLGGGKSPWLSPPGLGGSSWGPPRGVPLGGSVTSLSPVWILPARSRGRPDPSRSLLSGGESSQLRGGHTRGFGVRRPHCDHSRAILG